MQSLELTSNQIKELQETGRVTVEREVKNKDPLGRWNTYHLYEDGVIGLNHIITKGLHKPNDVREYFRSPFKVGEVYEWCNSKTDYENKTITILPTIKAKCLTSDIKEKDGKWYWVGEFEMEGSNNA